MRLALVTLFALALRLPAEVALEPAFGKLTFNQPVAISPVPGAKDRLLVVEKNGTLQVVEGVGKASQSKRKVFDITEPRDGKLETQGESGFLGVALHPNYLNNPQVFVYYSLKIEGKLHQRVSSFRLKDVTTLQVDQASEQVLISQLDPAGNHNGGDIHFGPDGCLYLSVGDGSLWENRVTQRLDAGFFGGILRLDVDRKPGNLPPNPGFGVNPEAYSIPADNPFVGITRYEVGGRVVWDGSNPSALRTEFFALGLRNPWQFSFDPLTGELWCNDVGFGSREEINRIRPGGNYGWPAWEGTMPTTDPPVAGMSLPEFEYTHLSGRTAITASRFHRGTRYPSLDGTYLFADWSGDIGVLRPGLPGEPEVEWIANLPGVIAFGTDPRDGSLLLTTGFGRIHRLVHRPVTDRRPWPRRLSETGLFSDLRALVPRPGLIPYDINAPFWSDHAIKRRWFALPGDDAFMTFARDEPWTFPKGTVWVKHFDIETIRGNPATRRKLETRFLVKTASEVLDRAPDRVDIDISRCLITIFSTIFSRHR